MKREAEIVIDECHVRTNTKERRGRESWGVDGDKATLSITKKGDWRRRGRGEEGDKFRDTKFR